jgi:dTDP-glucose 4,6-dehydratase
MDGSKIAGLGWQPSVPFDDGIGETVAWFVANREWWGPIKSGEWDDYYERQYARRLATSVNA